MTASIDSARRGLVLDIDLDAIRHNAALARQCQPHSRLFAVVKADAYGHGAVAVARALVGIADGFAVVSIGEALQLREAGIVAPVLVMRGALQEEELALCDAQGFSTVFHNRVQLEWLERYPAPDRLSPWLKVDTGMGRLGLLPEDAVAWLEKRSIPWRGVMTHFACADEPGNPHTRAQIETFDALPVPPGADACIANSAGVLFWPHSARDWSRPGIMLYGLHPASPATDALLPAGDPATALQPAMQATATLLTVKTLPAGHGVGYAQTWRARRPTRIGLVAAGYGDGLPRVFGAGASIRVQGRACPLVGRVSMDSLAIDLSAVPQARIGDEAVLWGAGHPVEILASAAGTINYELVTTVRGCRRYRG